MDDTSNYVKNRFAIATMIDCRMLIEQYSWAAALLLGCTLSLTGCERRLDPQEYGKIIYEVPKIQTGDDPYPLPELIDPEESTTPTK